MADYRSACGYWSYFLFICCGLEKVVQEGTGFLYWLINNGNADPSGIHVIGGSLGAEVAKRIGLKFYEDNRYEDKLKLGRVTGNAFNFCCTLKFNGGGYRRITVFALWQVWILSGLVLILRTCRLHHALVNVPSRSKRIMLLFTWMLTTQMQKVQERL